MGKQLKNSKIAAGVLLGSLILAVLFLVKTPNGFVGRSEGHYFTTSSGIKIFYAEAGAKQLPTVVLIHGFAVNGDLNWTLSGVKAALGENYHLIIPDLRGHGLSDKPHKAEDYGVEMARDISELLTELKIPRASIAGYSLGGFVALKFAQLFPEQAEKILVMGAGWDEVGIDSLAVKLKPAADALRSNEGVPPLSTFIKPDRNPGMLHKYWVLFMTKFLNDPLALAALIDGSTGLTIGAGELASLQNIPCIIIGSEDPFYEAAEKIQTILPQAELHVIPGKNHMTAVTSKAFVDYFHRCMNP